MGNNATHNEWWRKNGFKSISEMNIDKLKCFIPSHKKNQNET